MTTNNLSNAVPITTNNLSDTRIKTQSVDMATGIDNVLPSHIATEIKNLTDYAKELTPLLDDSFGHMFPRTPELGEFIDDFSIKLFHHTYFYYSITPDETGEDPLAAIHNTLQPLWSNENTSPISDAVIGSNPHKNVRHHQIYQRDDGVWDIDNLDHTTGLTSVLTTIPDEGNGDILAIGYGITDNVGNGFTWLDIKRYTRD